MKLRFKKFTSVITALFLISALCFSTSVNAVENETVSYKFFVTCSEDIVAFEGELTYPDTLTAASVEFFDEDIEWDYDGDLSSPLYFNVTKAETPYDFSEGVALVTVNFKINGEYDYNDIKVSIDEFYTQSQAKTSENTPYCYGAMLDDNIIYSGYADIDYPDNNSDNVYTTSSGKSINLENLFYRKSDDTADFGFSGPLKDIELLGVQKKNTGQSIRFVSVIDNEIAQDADDYGYIAVASNDVADARAKLEEFTYETAPENNIKACKGTSNNVSGDYGNYSSDKPYKYVTYAVNNISDKAVAAMFYIKKGDKVYYATYTNGAGNVLKSCAVNWALLG